MTTAAPLKDALAMLESISLDGDPTPEQSIEHRRFLDTYANQVIYESPVMVPGQYAVTAKAKQLGRTLPHGEIRIDRTARGIGLTREQAERSACFLLAELLGRTGGA